MDDAGEIADTESPFESWNEARVHLVDDRAPATSPEIGGEPRFLPGLDFGKLIRTARTT